MRGIKVKVNAKACLGTVLALFLAAGAIGQGAPAASANASQPAPSSGIQSLTPEQLAALRKAAQHKIQIIARSEMEGINVRVKDIARFKGVTTNQLQGIGLV